MPSVHSEYSLIWDKIVKENVGLSKDEKSKSNYSIGQNKVSVLSL